MNIKFLRIIDKYVFGFFILTLFWLKYLFLINRKNITQRPKKILIIRLWALGSSLLTFPMVKQLRDNYGVDVQYDLMATSRNIGVFKNQGYFGNIYNIFSLKGMIKIFLGFKKYDIVIDAEEYFNVSSLVSLWTGKISIGYNNVWTRGLAYTESVQYIKHGHNLINCISLLEKLEIKTKNPKIMERLVVNKKDMIRVGDFLEVYKGKKLLCLHTGGAETSPDRFRSIEKWGKLIKKIFETYGDSVIVFLSGTKFEEQGVLEIYSQIGNIENVINICGKFNLFEFAYLLERCDLMISNDTGPMHLSACMGTKTIGLFGPNLPERFGPWPLSRNISLYKGTGHIFTSPEYGIFKKDTEKNINKITVQDVFDNMKFII